MAHSLKDIILSRLRDIQTLKTSFALHQSSRALPDRLLPNSSFDITHHYRTRQAERLEQELSITNDLARQSVIAVFRDCLQIMTNYDSQFSFVEIDKVSEQTAEDTLRRTLAIFLKSHQNSKSTHLLRFLSEGGSAKDPRCYLNWLADWSRAVYFDCLRNTTPQSKARLSAAAITYLPDHLPEQYKKVRRSVRMDSTNEFKINFFSKEHLYSFIREELGGYYQLRSCMGLDIEYLQSITKNHRRMMGDPVTAMGTFLAESAFHDRIRREIDRYTLQYQQICKTNPLFKADSIMAKSTIQNRRERKTIKACTEPCPGSQSLSKIKLSLLKELKTQMMPQASNLVPYKRPQKAPIFNFIKKRYSSTIKQFSRKAFVGSQHQEPSGMQYSGQDYLMVSRWASPESPTSRGDSKILKTIVKNETKLNYSVCKAQSKSVGLKSSSNVFRQNWTKMRRLDRHQTIIS